MNTKKYIKQCISTFINQSFKGKGCITREITK